jgi:outer membrane autotransporter protein
MHQSFNNLRKSRITALLGSASTAVLLLTTLSLAAVSQAAAENIDSYVTVNLPRIISGDLYVGFSGNGTLDIRNGGSVVVNVGKDSFLGAWLGRTGTVLVGGSNASWINNRELYVGYMGRGDVIISDGGTVTDTGGYIGHQPNSSGKVTVTGIGSTWSSAGTITVGDFSTGELVINDGGTVNAVSMKLGAGTTGAFAGAGRLTLNGTTGARSVLATSQIAKGTGNARLELNGGILRTTQDNATFLSGFASEDVVINTGGAFVDSNGHNIGVASPLSGDGSLTKLGAGELTLSGVNTYSGGTAVNGGVLAVSADASLGHASGPLSFDGGTLRFGSDFAIAATRAIVLNAGGGTFDTNGFDSTISQNITGSGSLTKAGAGALTLTGTNTYTGGTLVNGGTLVIGAPDALASGPLTFGGGTLQFDYAGTLDRPITVSSGGFTVDTNGNAQTMSAPLTGSGPFTKTGSGSLNLTGNSPLTGATSVLEGHLAVNGSLAGSGVTVHNAASLGGNGMVGGLIVQSGGFATPGNSIGTLDVAGNVTFQAGSIYQVEVNAAGQSDKIAATGNATLSGGSVQVLAETGTYGPSTNYTILTADGGVAGIFAGVSSNFAFLDPTLAYDANNVFLTLVRKTEPTDPTDPPTDPTEPDEPAPTPVAFHSVATSSNQYGTADAVEALGSGNPVFDAVIGQSVSGARQAFDALSGEAHASATAVAYADSGLVREAILMRLRQPLSASLPTFVQGGYTAAYAADLPGAAPQPVTVPVAATPRYSLWGEGFGSWGKIDSNSNAAGLDTSTGGFILGADAQVSNAFRIGLAGGFTRTTYDVDARLSSGSNDSIYAALYGSGSWGGLNLRLGASYAWHDFDVSRTVSFPGFSDRMHASYDGWTAQAFGELGYQFSLRAVLLEPFVGASVLRLHTDGFVEEGGAAALTRYGQDQDLATTTLGVRAEARISQDMPLTLRGLLGWRHAYGDVNPSALLAFSGGASAFNVAGVPIDRDALVAEAGLDWQIDKDMALGVSYSGQIGERAQEHAVKGNFSWRFDTY